MSSQIGKINGSYDQRIGFESTSSISESERFRFKTQKDVNNNQKTTTSQESVKVTLSEEALRKAGLLKESQPSDGSQDTNLTQEETQEVADLKSRDREVRAHEMAHMAAGGSLVRKGVSYDYKVGPDGLRYAVGGEVSIDTSPVEDDPSATIRKMEKVKSAALAPAEPSSQDRAVAASAAQKEAAARQELNQKAFEQ